MSMEGTQLSWLGYVCLYYTGNEHNRYAVSIAIVFDVATAMQLVGQLIRGHTRITTTD